VSVVKFIEPVNDPRAVNQDKKNILFSVRIVCSLIFMQTTVLYMNSAKYFAFLRKKLPVVIISFIICRSLKLNRFYISY